MKATGKSGFAPSDQQGAPYSPTHLNPETREKLSFLQIYNRLMRLRANRRRIGPFDWSPLSWDSDTTRRRAVRIHLRLHGVREPLYSVHRDDRAVPWNAYHG